MLLLLFSQGRVAHGVKGEPGPDGLPGNSILIIIQRPISSEPDPFANATAAANGSDIDIIGPRGPPGDDGFHGSQGSKGEKGDKVESLMSDKLDRSRVLCV